MLQILGPLNLNKLLHSDILQIGKDSNTGQYNTIVQGIDVKIGLGPSKYYGQVNKDNKPDGIGKVINQKGNVVIIGQFSGASGKPNGWALYLMSEFGFDSWWNVGWCKENKFHGYAT